MRGSSLPVLARSPVRWHFILPGDSTLERLGTAHTHPSSAGACHHQERRCDGSECAGVAGAVSGSRQLPCGKLSGWVSPHPGSHPAWLKNVTQTGARGPAWGQAARGSWHPSHNRREQKRCVLASTCPSLCFLGLSWAGKDHPFFAAFAGRALLHGWDWACLGHAGSLEGLALGKKFSSKLSVVMGPRAASCSLAHCHLVHMHSRVPRGQNCW